MSDCQHDNAIAPTVLVTSASQQRRHEILTQAKAVSSSEPLEAGGALRRSVLPPRMREGRVLHVRAQQDTGWNYTLVPMGFKLISATSRDASCPRMVQK